MSTGLNGVDSARAALAQGKPALVWRKVVADTETPVGAALKLFEDGRGDFLLESVEGGEVRGRYSLIGLDPDLVFRATGNDAAINAQWQFALMDTPWLPSRTASVKRATSSSSPSSWTQCSPTLRHQ